MDHELRKQYWEFMSEHEQLGHMTEVHKADNEKGQNYIAHYAARREDMTTRKVRFVFDASAKTSTRYSLNDLQMIGSTIQCDLLRTILVFRFRQHKFIITADVMEMYCLVEVPEVR